MDTTTAQPAAGWYTDPADSANERWWGGVDWTDHVRPLATAMPSYQPTASIPVPPPAPQLAEPSPRAAHAAPAQHVAESPLTSGVPVAPSPSFQPNPPAAAPIPYASTPATLTAPQAFTPQPPAMPAAPHPFTAPPAFSVTTPEPALPAFVPPPAPAPVVAQAAEAPAAEPVLPPPLTNTLVHTPAPAPIALAPIASDISSDVPLAAEATIPQYASQVQVAQESSLGALANAWKLPGLDAATGGFPALALPPLPAALAPAAPALPAAITQPTAPAAQSPFPFPLPSTAPPAPGTAVAVAPALSAASWAAARPAPPRNTKAVVGFVLSLIGVSIAGLIVSIAGLRTARKLEDANQFPAGRKLARWGVGLSTLSLAALTVVTTLVVTVGPSFIYLIPGANELASSVVASAYDKEAFEATLSEAVLTETGVAPTAVACPASFTALPGNTIECRIELETGVAFLVRSTVEDNGSITTQTVS